jgi:uncharacterized tellurite resistance protein B-like protein
VDFEKVEHILLAVIVVIAALLVPRAFRRGKKRSRKSRRKPTSSRQRAVSQKRAADGDSCWENADSAAGSLDWAGASDELRIGGLIHKLKIVAPRTYVRRGWGARGADSRDPCEVNVKLPVRRAKSAESLSYWPRYDQLSPEQRWLYLEWLAVGRGDLPRDPGFLFLYFYGLERRVLVDREDFVAVFDEVVGLRRAVLAADQNSRGSFVTHGTSFLWHLVASSPEVISADRVEAFIRETTWWSEDHLGRALSWFASRHEVLPCSMARVVAEQSPHSKRSVAVTRVADEFGRLFELRYSQSYNQGMALRVAKRPLRLTYSPSNPSLREVRAEAPNPLGIASQFKKLATIWNDCVDDLRGYSSAVGKDGGEVISLGAWDALPPELRQRVDHPATDGLCQIVDHHTNAEGHCFVEISAICELFGLKQRDRLTPRQSRKLVETAALIGFSLEPDAVLMGRSYYWKEPVTVFPRVSSAGQDNDRYVAAATFLRFGVAVAQADGQIDDDELATITHHVEFAFELHDSERQRLEALRALLVARGVDLSMVSKRIKSVLPREQRRTVGRFLVVVAATDEQINEEETLYLRRCFRLLGLGVKELNSTLEELAGPVEDDQGDGSEDAEKTVLAHPAAEPAVDHDSVEAETDEAADEAPPPSSTFKLDRMAVEAIMKETQEVAHLLAEAMQDDDPAEDPNEDSNEGPAVVVDDPVLVGASAPGSESVQGTEASPVPDGLDERYAAFYRRVLSRAAWPRPEIEEIARSNSLMLGGAIESVNEWAYDALGGPLLYEEGDQVEIDLDLID